MCDVSAMTIVTPFTGHVLMGVRQAHCKDRHRSIVEYPCYVMYKLVMIFLVNHGLPLNTIPAQTAEFIPHCIPHCPRTASWQQAPLTWHTIKFPSSITQFVHSRYVESIHIVHYQYTSYTLCTCVHGYVCTYTGANTNTMSHVYMHTHTVQYTHACTQHTHTPWQWPVATVPWVTAWSNGGYSSLHQADWHAAQTHCRQRCSGGETTHSLH